jgi:hypothetical protein
MVATLRGLLVAALALLSGLAAAQGHKEVSEQDKAVAREMFRRGDEAYRAGDYEAALKAFVGADTIMRVPTTGLEAGRSLMALDRFVEARGYIARVAKSKPAKGESKPLADARKEAKRLLRRLDLLIPKVTIAIEGSEASDTTVLIDGSEVRASDIGKPIRADPGDHVLRASAPGFVTGSKRFSLKEGETRELRLTLEAQPEEEELPSTAAVSASPVWPWAVLGVGAALVTAGAVTGGLSLASASDYQDRCDAGTRVCPADAESTHDRALVLAHVSTATFIAGGVGLGVGVFGLLFFDGEENDEAVQLVFTPTWAGLRGVLP